MKRIIVKDEARWTAPFLLIGEAPGRKEVQMGKPFCGPTGMKQDRWWRERGLQRRDFYITNSVPWQLGENKKITKEEWAECVARLKDIIAKMPNLRLIVPTGSFALRALFPERDLPITKVRGFVFDYKTQGRTVKVIPTLHTSSTFYNPENNFCCGKDWDKIAAEAKQTSPVPVHHHRIGIDAWDIEGFIESTERAEPPRRAISIDIEGAYSSELLKGNGVPVSCVGFSPEPAFSWVIPTLRTDYRKLSQYNEAWRIIKELCHLKYDKVLQNGMFDWYRLHMCHHIDIKHYNWDLLGMHHALYPRQPHTLAYMASIYTKHRYWKDMPGKAGRDKDLEYNGIDNSVQRELFDILYDELVQKGKLDYYKQLYARMHRPLAYTMFHGIRMDTMERKVWAARLRSRVIELQDELTKAAGTTLYAKKDFSPVKLRRFLYETLGLPVQYKRATKKKARTVSADKVAIRRLRMKFVTDKPAAKRALDAIIECRKSVKMGQFLADSIEDKDGRVRCDYSMSNEENDAGTGRLKSKKNALGTGMNLQNVDRRVRKVFKPDFGCLLVSADLSQVESRFVGMYSKDPELMEQARSRPSAFDVHKYNAGIIFRKDVDDVTDEERYLAKRAVHASNYGMHGERLSMILMAEDIDIPARECQAMIDAYIDNTEGIRMYHKNTRRLMLNDRVLVSLFGREMSFAGIGITDEVYRNGYAFRPQASAADMLNQYGFITAYHYLRKTKHGHTNLQVHDDVSASVKPPYIYDYMAFLDEQLGQTLDFEGDFLVVPVSYKIQTAWGVGHEFKEFPKKRSVVQDVIHELLAGQ